MLFLLRNLFTICNLYTQEILLPQPPTDTESTTVDIGGFSDTSQSLPGLNEGLKKVHPYIRDLKEFSRLIVFFCYRLKERRKRRNTSININISIIGRKRKKRRVTKIDTRKM